MVAMPIPMVNLLNSCTCALWLQVATLWCSDDCRGRAVVKRKMRLVLQEYVSEGAS